MENFIYIPNSIEEAGGVLQSAAPERLEQMTRAEFGRAWCALIYLNPNLHPDGWEEDGSGWDGPLRWFASEAWQRAEDGDLLEDELYPSDAQWAGLYDRMHTHTSDETARRNDLTAAFGRRCDG